MGTYQQEYLLVMGTYQQEYVLVMGTYLLPLYVVLVMGTHLLPLYELLKHLGLLSAYDRPAIVVRSAFGVRCL